MPNSRNCIFLEVTVINDKFISLIQLLCSIEVCSNVSADVASTSRPHLAPTFSVNRELYLYSLSVPPMTCCGHRRQYNTRMSHAPCMLDILRYRRILRICNIFAFPRQERLRERACVIICSTRDTIM